MTDPRIEAAAVALLSFDTSTPLDDVPGPVGRDVYRRARAALAAADNAATITTAEELDAAPVGSVVRAHWEDGSQPDYLTMRCREGGASSSGFGVAGGKYWTGMASWGATLTIIHWGTE